MTSLAAERHDPLADAIRFFTALYAEQTGILELRTVPPEQTPEQRRIAWRLRDFVPVVQGKFAVHRIDRFIKETIARRMAAYFGVALRTPVSAKDRKGDARHCQTLTALFVDADFKHLGEVETRKRLSDFPIPPSIVLNSGGGLHPYWLLRQPLDLQRDYRGAQSILRRLAKGVADVVDEGVSEPARILRIPGSLNFKKEYGDPRRVVVEHI
jgi:hypothetical protein